MGVEASRRVLERAVASGHIRAVSKIGMRKSPQLMRRFARSSYRLVSQDYSLRSRLESNYLYSMGTEMF
jgi:hypothetical protein